MQGGLISDGEVEQSMLRIKRLKINCATFQSIHY